MAHQFRVHIPNSPDIEFPTYEDALATLRRVGVGSATLSELDENGSVRATLTNEELKAAVGITVAISDQSVFQQRAKGRLVSDE